MEKSNNTKLEKYGDINYVNTEEFKNKSRKSKFEKYGNETFVNIKKGKKTKFEKYGNENYNNKEQYKKTCLEKYGVNHVMQVHEIFEKQQKNSYKSGIYKDIIYRGSFELHFLKQLDKNSLLHLVKKCFKIKYELNNNTHIYFPDFIINNTIIEIKSTWTYDRNGKDLELKNKNDNKYKAASNIENYNFIVLMSLNEIDEYVNHLSYSLNN